MVYFHTFRVDTVQKKRKKKNLKQLKINRPHPTEEKNMSKNEGEKTTEKPAKKSKFKKVADATLGQTITRTTRPLVEKIPPGIIQVLRDLKVDNVLDIASIALVSLLPEESEWSDKAGDFINEFSAELIKVIQDKPGKEAETSEKSENSQKAGTAATATIIRVLLNSELSCFSEKFLGTINTIMVAKKDVKGFSEGFFSSINKLGDKDMLMLLDHLTALLDNKKQEELEVLLSFFFKEIPAEQKSKALSEMLGKIKGYYSTNLKPATIETGNILLTGIKNFDQYIESRIPEPIEDPGMIKGVINEFLNLINCLKFWRK